MIVLSLALVIAAAVALFIGLFVTTGLTFIYIAIGLCLASLLLLWVGTRSRKGDAPTAPSPAVYGGARAGTTAAPAARPATVARGERSEDDDRSEEVDELDELTAPSGGEVVRATTARDRAAARVAEAAPDAADDEDEPSTADDDTSSVQVVSPTASRAMASMPEDPAPKKAATRKSATKKAATRKAATKKSATGRGTRGEAARQRLAEIPGVGPAKQEALLSRYGSLEAIRDAPVEDIVDNVRGFGQALATRVKDAL